MGVITDMLREQGYSEWDGQAGSMIGASYDWRLSPTLLESRDQYFTKLMQQTEAMVAADPEHRPAVLVAFSLGCRIAKYFIHFCHAQKGQEWVANNIAHFVPLGGPWLGAVQLMKAGDNRTLADYIANIPCCSHDRRRVRAVGYAIF